MGTEVAIVTGAGQGIGAAIARELAQGGYHVALIDVNADAVKHAAEALKRDGLKAQAFSGDILDAAFLQKMTGDILSGRGRIDVLVNNAGIIRDNFLLNISEAEWDAVLDVNLKGAFLCCKSVVPAMKEQKRGRIVNIASRSWLGNIGQANYSASKGGLVSLTRTLALELARDQINVNAVAPGLIDTPMTQKLPDKAKERLLRMQPTGQMGTVEDIAAAVAFLASERARFITGQVLHVDGGKSCGLLSL